MIETFMWLLACLFDTGVCVSNMSASFLRVDTTGRIGRQMGVSSVADSGTEEGHLADCTRYSAVSRWVDSTVTNCMFDSCHRMYPVNPGMGVHVQLA